MNREQLIKEILYLMTERNMGFCGGGGAGDGSPLTLFDFAKELSYLVMPVTVKELQQRSFPNGIEMVTGGGGGGH
jgi:hypothetical protein